MSQLADRGDQRWDVNLLGSAISAADNQPLPSKRYCLFLCVRDRRHPVVNYFRVVVNILLFLGARVRRLATHPTEQSWVVSAVQGNNEVTVWDLETGARRQALWASHTPPLSQTQVCRRLITLYDAFRYGH